MTNCAVPTQDDEVAPALRMRRSSRHASRGFCSLCGCAVTRSFDSEPGTVWVSAGSLGMGTPSSGDGAPALPALQLDAEIYVRSRASWLSPTPGVRQCEEAEAWVRDAGSLIYGYGHSFSGQQSKRAASASPTVSTQEGQPAQGEGPKLKIRVETEDSSDSSRFGFAAPGATLRKQSSWDSPVSTPTAGHPDMWLKSPTSDGQASNPFLQLDHSVASSGLEFEPIDPDDPLGLGIDLSINVDVDFIESDNEDAASFFADGAIFGGRPAGYGGVPADGAAQPQQEEEHIVQMLDLDFAGDAAHPVPEEDSAADAPAPQCDAGAAVDAGASESTRATAYADVALVESSDDDDDDEFEECGTRVETLARGHVGSRLLGHVIMNGSTSGHGSVIQQ